MDSDGDETVVPFYEVFDTWLLWHIAEKRKLFDEAQKWQIEYERQMSRALASHVPATERLFVPALAIPQELDFDRGRILDTSIPQ